MTDNLKYTSHSIAGLYTTIIEGLAWMDGCKSDFRIANILSNRTFFAYILISILSLNVQNETWKKEAVDSGSAVRSVYSRQSSKK